MALQGRCFGVDAWTPTQVEEELRRPGGTFLVDDTLRGFAVAWVVFEDLHLLQIATVPEARRGGLATELQEALFAATRADQGFLEVRADNEPAVRFYEKHGWRRIATRAHYYADAVDAWVYRIDLKGRRAPVSRPRSS